MTTHSSKAAHLDNEMHVSTCSVSRKTVCAKIKVFPPKRSTWGQGYHLSVLHIPNRGQGYNLWVLYIPNRCPAVSVLRPVVPRCGNRDPGPLHLIVVDSNENAAHWRRLRLPSTCHIFASSIWLAQAKNYTKIAKALIPGFGPVVCQR